MNISQGTKTLIFVGKVREQWQEIFGKVNELYYCNYDVRVVTSIFRAG